MEKTQRTKWFLWTGLIIGLLVLGVATISSVQNGQVDYKEIGALLVGGMALFGIVISAAFSSNSGTEITEMKKNISSIDNRVSGLESSVIRITENDLKEAEKSVIFFNAVTDIKESIDARKEIDALGKQIKKLSAKIIKEKFEINEHLNRFVIEITNEISSVITTEYAYGLDVIELEELKTLLFNKIDIIYEHTEKKEIGLKLFKIVRSSIDKNIFNYIKNLKGIQDLNNGKRREKFKYETLEFIKLLSHHIVDIANKFEKTSL